MSQAFMPPKHHRLQLTSFSADCCAFLLASVGGPKYTTVFMFSLVFGSAFSSRGNFSLLVKTMDAPAWLMMYSTAVSPSESYKGTAGRG